MLRIDEDDRYAYITGASASDIVIIGDAIKARPQGYQYMPAYKDRIWDGYISLLKGRKFPAGLISHVVETLNAAEISHEIVRNENLPQPTSVVIEGYELRQYQTDAVVDALTNVRGVLHMATNAGKTLIMASVIRATGCKAVVVVPSRPLLMQTSADLAQMLDIEIGMYGAGQQEALDVTVTTMASLEKLLRTVHLGNNVTLFVDECHHTRAESIFDNIFDIPGPYRFGMSGTPLTYDKLSDMKLIGATGPVICRVSNQDLISNGYSVPPIIFFTEIDSPQLEDVDYQEAYRTCIVQNEARHKSIADICQEEVGRGPIMILVNWIEHAASLCSMLENVPFEKGLMVATGQDSPEEIANKLKLMSDGMLDVLIATDVFGEGINIPSIATLILAGGGKSHIKILQKVGRGLRTDDGKTELHVYDFLDDTNDYLLDHSEQRYKVYKDEGFEVRLRE